jgi:glycosyltransferase involved in cell wall biosynthesis
VVTTPRGAEGLMMGDRRPPLVVAESTDEMANAIVALLNSDERRRTIGQQARAFVGENFSATAYAQRIEAIWAELRSQSASDHS